MRLALVSLFAAVLAACGPDYMAVGSYELVPRSAVATRVYFGPIHATNVMVADSPGYCDYWRAEQTYPKTGLQLHVFIGGEGLGTYVVGSTPPAPGTFTVDTGVTFNSWSPAGTLDFSESADSGYVEVFDFEPDVRLGFDLNVKMASGSLVKHRIYASYCR